jgi:ABC-2 type transport system ATP-binding protein
MTGSTDMYLMFWEIVEEFRHTGTAVLLVTHMIHDRHRFDRIYEMQEGVLHAAR